VRSRAERGCPTADASSDAITDCVADGIIDVITDVITRLDRVIQYAAAGRLRCTLSGVLGRPVKPGEDDLR
jgi:hypothetical protein